VTSLRSALVVLSLAALGGACASTDPITTGPDRDTGSVRDRDTGRDRDTADERDVAEEIAEDVGAVDTQGEDTAVPPDVETDTAPADTVDNDVQVDVTEDVATPDDTGPDAPTGPVECTSANAVAKCGSAGACVDGFCCDMACAGECDACNIPGREGRCSPRPSTVICRAASGQCDAAEYCSGVGSVCPADVKAPVGAACGSSTDGECDNADSCDGAGNCAPNVEPAGRACGSATATVCDLADRCNGLGACSPNYESTTTICRAAAGACDAAERCDGVGACPADVFAAAGSPCGANTDTACTDPDTCTAAGVCQPNHAADGGSCGAPLTQYQCGGTGCAAVPQSRAVPQICATGECVPGAAGAWADLDACTANEVCVSTASSAVCDLCDTPPAEYCTAGDAYYFDGTPGTCAAGVCSYTPAVEDCTGGCTVVSGDALCTSCNEAIMSVQGAPLWTWNGGNEGWDMGADWSRDDDYARSGSWSMDFFFPSGYYDSEFDRTQWTAAYDFTQCSGCTVQATFWLLGSTESCCDGLTLQCSGNGGSSWTAVGDEIRGYYSNWTSFTRTLPASCLTSTMKLAFIFDTDFSIVDDGYVIDDMRLHTTNTAPNGYLDNASATTLSGWACDGDAWATEIDVRLEFVPNGTGTPIVRTVRASEFRDDLITASVCGSTGNHGYTFVYDDALLAALGAGTHTVRAFGVDGPQPCGAGEYALSGSPKTFVR
jgi:hypothetical protein